MLTVEPDRLKVNSSGSVVMKVNANLGPIILQIWLPAILENKV
jgi:hypothetical protein